MQFNYTQLNPYPGVWAGTFTMVNPMQGGDSVTSPYICAIPISSSNASANSSSTNFLTAFNQPANGVTEYLYEYNYSMVPNSVLAGLKENVVLVPTATGSMNLISTIQSNMGSVTVVLPPTPTTNSTFPPEVAAQLALSKGIVEEKVQYGVPTITTLYGAPAGRYLYQLDCAGVDSSSQVCSIVNQLAATGSPTYYIDIFNKLLFVSQPSETVITPVSITLPSPAFLSIMESLGNPSLVESKSGQWVIQVNSGPGSTPTTTTQSQAVVAGSQQTTDSLSFLDLLSVSSNRLQKKVVAVVERVRSIFRKEVVTA